MAYLSQSLLKVFGKKNMEKGENVGNQYFLFQQCFSKVSLALLLKLRIILN